MAELEMDHHRADAQRVPVERMAPAASAVGYGYETYPDADKGRLWASDTHSVGLQKHIPQGWLNASRIVLTPIAYPSVLGLYGFAAATFVVGARYAHWYGEELITHQRLFPFAFFLGGLAQFAAGLMAFRARDTLASAFHGLWGGFWFAYGLFFFTVSIGALPIPDIDSNELGFWFIGMAMVTCAMALGALGHSLAFFLITVFLGGACILNAIGFIYDSSDVVVAAGWAFMASSWVAVYLATAYLMEATFGHVILPLTSWRARANVPGARLTVPVQYLYGMPGSRVGQ